MENFATKPASHCLEIIWKITESKQGLKKYVKPWMQESQLCVFKRPPLNMMMLQSPMSRFSIAAYWPERRIADRHNTESIDLKDLKIFDILKNRNIWGDAEAFPNCWLFRDLFHEAAQYRHYFILFFMCIFVKNLNYNYPCLVLLTILYCEEFLIQNLDLQNFGVSWCS